MRHSTDHILSSHGGNLPRPAEFDKLLAKASEHQEEVQAKLPGAVEWVIDKQIECGVDIINDGEYVKAAEGGNYGSYMAARSVGFDVRDTPEGTKPKRGFTAEREIPDFPGFYKSGLWFAGSGGPIRPGFATPGGQMINFGARQQTCTGDLKYTGYDLIQADIDAIKKGLEGKSGVDGFVASLGPLSLGAGKTNLHYASEEEYMFAVADVMHEEYKAITDAGLIVQVDEPEFATTWSFYPDWTVEDLRKYLDFAVEIINHSLRGLPEELVRFHMCWGSGHRPHVHDIGFEHLADKLLGINAQCYTFEASNPRHAHEYHVFEDLKLPDGKIIAPGVVGHYTDLVEHPELVAERLINYAKLVGMENVHASTDCGIGSRVGHEEIVWAKLKAMSDGCQIATKRLKAGL